ncbi:hypothetical protein GCM10023162_18580 [Klenkia terrae]
MSAFFVTVYELARVLASASRVYGPEPSGVVSRVSGSATPSGPTMVPWVSTSVFSGVACGAAQVTTTVCGSVTATSVISLAPPAAKAP